MILLVCLLMLFCYGDVDGYCYDCLWMECLGG